MMASRLPYFEVPTWRPTLPLVGEHVVTVFGLLVAIGVVVGFRCMLAYARAHDMDVRATDRLGVWALVLGFCGAHLVSVLAYYPARVVAEPWIVLPVFAGLSSVGGFAGGLLAFGLLTPSDPVARRRFADALTFGLLPGFAIGRLGCSLVHDHPGREVSPDTWLALGPWPDGAWRHDLATIELAGLVVLLAVVVSGRRWHRAPPGHLTGAVAIAYGVGRFALDFLRAADARYLGLTPAQLACLGFVAGGLWLVGTRYDGRVDRRDAAAPAGRPAPAERRRDRGRVR